MSFIIRASRTATSMRHVATPVHARYYTAASPQLLKETSRDIPNLGEALERAKQENLRQQKKGHGSWDPNLASQSEENVHADREGGKKDFKELQREAKETAEREYKTGTGEDTESRSKS